MKNVLLKYDFYSTKQTLHQQMVNAIVELMKNTNTKHIKFSEPLPSLIYGENVQSEVHRVYVEEVFLDNYNNVQFFLCDGNGKSENLARFLQLPSGYFVPCELDELYNEIWDCIFNN